MPLSALPLPGALEVRPAQPGEAGLVLRLIRELAEFERLAHEVDATEEGIRAALFGPSPRVSCEIARWAGEPAGFALWFYTFSTFRGRHGLRLEDLFVRPGLRGRGIGRALLARLARRCRDEGLPRLEWAVLDWNAEAIGFYRALGAEPQDGWTAYRLGGPALERLAAAPAEAGAAPAEAGAAPAGAGAAPA